jgi:hypothetical protein
LRPTAPRLESATGCTAGHQPEEAIHTPGRFSWLFLGTVLLVATVGADRAEQERWVDLFTATDLSAWRPPTGDWRVVGAVKLDSADPRRLAFTPGSGILVNGPAGKAPDLVTRRDFGDVVVHVEFLIPRRSNSGVKLMGLYEIQIYDSHGVRRPSASDCGGIYPRAELTPRYHHIDEGIPPRLNAVRKSGEWQTLDITFRAPRFDATGKKTANARFDKVLLNGQLIHDGVEVATPTGHAWRDPERARGPLLLQGDHGPVAFRNVRARPLGPAAGKGGERTGPWPR